MQHQCNVYSGRPERELSQMRSNPHHQVFPGMGGGGGGVEGHNSSVVRVNDFFQGGDILDPRSALHASYWLDE